MTKITLGDEISLATRHGKQVTTVGITYEGRTIGSLTVEHSKNEHYERLEAAASGVSISARDDEGKRYGDYYRSMASRGPATTYDHEPTTAEASEDALSHVLSNEGFSFYKYAEKGSQVPDYGDYQHLFMDGVKMCKARGYDGRQFRNGKITGEPWKS